MDSESTYYPILESQQPYPFSAPDTPAPLQFGSQPIQNQFGSPFQNKFPSHFSNQLPLQSQSQFFPPYSSSPPLPQQLGKANTSMNMKSFILPPSDPKSPFHSDLPSQKPIPKLVKRLHAWIKVIHSLLTYYKMLQISCSQISKIHLTMCESVDFPMFDNGDSTGFDYRAALKVPSDLRDLINSQGNQNNMVSATDGLAYNSSPSLVEGSVANSSYAGPSSTVSGSYFNTSDFNNDKISESRASINGKTVKGAIKRHNFSKDKEANEQFLPLGSHSIQDLPTLLILYHKNILLINLNFSHELSNMIIPRLEELKKDLLMKIKEIKSLNDDFKNGLKQDIAITGQKLYDYLDSLEQETTKVSPSNNMPVPNNNTNQRSISGKFKRDPFVLKFKLDYQLRNQFIQENFLQEAYINIQTTASQLEKIISEELKRSLNSLTFVIDNEIKLKYEVMINGLAKDGYSQKPYYQEWNSFVERDNNRSLLKSVQVGSPIPKVRKISDVEYPYKNSFLSKCIKAGYMEKKMKILKNYKKCFYLLTVNGLYEFNSMNDFQLSKAAPTASYPLNCCSLGVFDYSKNKFVMQYLKRSQGSTLTPNGTNAWSPSINYSNGNANPSAMFRFESEPNPFEKSLKIKSLVKGVETLAESVIDEPLSAAGEAISTANEGTNYFEYALPGLDGRSPGSGMIGNSSGSRTPGGNAPIAPVSSLEVGNSSTGVGNNGNEVIKITFKLDDQKEILMWYKYLKLMFQYDTCYERAMHIERMYLKKKREEKRAKEAHELKTQMQKEQQEEGEELKSSQEIHRLNENLINNEDNNTYINFDGNSSDTSSSNNNNSFNMFKGNNSNNINTITTVNNSSNSIIDTEEVKRKLLNPYGYNAEDFNIDEKYDTTDGFMTGIAPDIVILTDDTANTGADDGTSTPSYYFEEQEYNNNENTLPGLPSSELCGSGSTLNLLNGSKTNTNISYGSKMYKLGGNGSGMLLSGLRPKMRFTTSSPNVLNTFDLKKGATNESSGAQAVKDAIGTPVPLKMMNSGIQDKSENMDPVSHSIGTRKPTESTMSCIPTITHSNELGEPIEDPNIQGVQRRPAMERLASSSMVGSETSTTSRLSHKTHKRHLSGVSLKLSGSGNENSEMKTLRNGLAGLKLLLRKKDRKK